MDEIRKQLDSLMGQHRDVPLAQREKLKKTVVFSNHEVCKYHLCGFCPHSEFTKTKQDLGPCPKLHDDECKRAWDALSDREKERYGYEEQLLRRLDRFKSDLARRIAINTSIIEKTAANPRRRICTPRMSSGNWTAWLRISKQCYCRHSTC